MNLELCESISVIKVATMKNKNDFCYTCVLVMGDIEILLHDLLSWTNISIITIIACLTVSNEKTLKI